MLAAQLLNKPYPVKTLDDYHEENPLKALLEKFGEAHSHSIVLGGLELMS